MRSILVNDWLVLAVLALCCCHLSTSFTLQMAAPPSSNNRRGSSYSSGKGSNPYSKGSYSKGPSSYDSYKGNGGKSDYSNKKTFAPSPIMSEVRLGEEERLQKILARAGIASRRNAETMIAEGRVKVNNKLITELGHKVNPRQDKIYVDNKLISLPTQEAIHWIALYKPKNCLSTTFDEKDRESVMSLVPKAHDLHLVPVGRMGRDATGLMLLTNEVGWIHPLTHPSYSNRKKYELVVKGLLTEDELKELRRGLAIPSSTETLPVLDDLQIVDYDEGNELTMLKVTVDETSSTMLETMFGIIGSEIVSSKCLEFNGVGLRGLKKGEWKELTAIEITKVKTFCKLRTDEENQRSQRVVKALESTRFQQQQEEDRNAFYGNNNNQQSSYRNQATSSSPSSAGRQYSAPPSSNPRYPPRPQSTTSPTSSPRRESSTASPPSNRYNKDDSQSRSRSTTRTNSAALSDEDNKIPTKTSFLKYTRSKRTQS